MANNDKRSKSDTEVVGKRFIESDVQRYYAGKTVFITGSTGFMGKCLLEKLLRGCPDIKRIYLLVREKRGMSPEERIKNYFDDALFDTLREMGTEHESKIHLVVGDLIQEDMALSEKDKNAMIEEVNIMFHNASTVKFNERMSKALKINVMGTQAMIDLAKQCKHMEGFMYMSTAFSHCYQSTIMEEVYPSPADMKMVEQLITSDLASPNGLNKAALPNILGEFPNTYCFTKAIAEGLVDDAAKQASFPCIVYRPSIVVSTWKEPVRGWVGNNNGPGALIVGYTLGILHTALIKECPMDLIPVDMSINSMLVSMCDVVKERPSVSGALVYNYGSSVEKPISMSRFRSMCLKAGNNIETPSIHMIFMNFAVLTNCIWYFLILHVLFHVLPALIFDAYSFVTGNKMRALSSLKKVTMVLSTLVYFARREWRIDISEMNKVVDRMSSIDHELFFCDVRKLDWQDYGSKYWDGLRVYLLKDPMSTLPAAKRKLRIFETVYYIITYSIMLLIAYVTVRFLGLL